MSGDVAETRQVADTQELLNLATLAELRVFEFSGRATADPSDDPYQPDIDVDYLEAHEPELLVDRFRFTVKTPDADYLVDIASVYALSEPVEVATETRIDFAERVGFMTAVPYIRESIASSAVRLGRRAPLMDLVRPGDFKIKANISEGAQTQDADVIPVSTEPDAVSS